MRNFLRIPSLVMMLAALIAQSGCGGSGSSSAPTSGFSITVFPPNASVVVGGTRQFTAQARDSAGTILGGVSFAWHSSDTRIATSVGGGGGTFRGIAIGTVSITASASFVEQAGKGITNVVSAPVSLAVVATVEGTAAQGAPLADASISLRDARGQYAANSADAAGHFRVEAAGMTGPFLLKAVTPEGRVLYGMAPDFGTANVDPYTDLLVREWYAAHGSDADRAFAGQGTVPAAADMQTLDRGLSAKLADVLSAQGLDARQFSLLSTPFEADHSGFDAVLDQSHVDVAAGTVQLAGRRIQ
jgi:Big-like domain-containing protein